MDRITPTLESISGFEDWWLNSVGQNCIARYSASPFIQRFEKAWRVASRVGHGTKAEDLRSIQPDDVFAEHGIEKLDRQAAVKMGLRPRRKRDAATNPDQPEGDGTHDDTNSLREQAEALFSQKVVTPSLNPENK